MQQRGAFKRTAYSALFLLLLLAAACSGQSDSEIEYTAVPPTPSPEPSVTPAYPRVIFTAEHIQAASYWPFSDRPWTPTEADVAPLEEQLPTFLRETYPGLEGKLSGYARQYWGTVTREGNRAIYANFFCDENGNFSDFDWRTKPFQVIDGGECYFQALYDAQNGKFAWLIVNVES